MIKRNIQIDVLKIKTIAQVQIINRDYLRNLWSLDSNWN